MTSVAAGMALEGKTVFTYSIGNFPTLRCLEQIRNDCAYPKANVKIVCVGGGFVYGSLGMSHQATEDIAVMRALPGVAVLCPGDLVEAEEATKAIAAYPGTCYLRLGRGGEKRIHDRIDNFEIGNAIKIRDGEKVAVFSTGAIFDEIGSAVEILEGSGINPAVYTFPTVKPIDREVIERCAENYDLIVTVEEHNIVGGFGSAVARSFRSFAATEGLYASALMTHILHSSAIKNICARSSVLTPKELPTEYSQRWANEALVADLYRPYGITVPCTPCQISIAKRLLG